MAKQITNAQYFELFVVLKNQKQFEFPSINEWLNKPSILQNIIQVLNQQDSSRYSKVKNPQAILNNEIRNNMNYLNFYMKRYFDVCFLHGCLIWMSYLHGPMLSATSGIMDCLEEVERKLSHYMFLYIEKFKN